jgi:hypothetical protein
VGLKSKKAARRILDVTAKLPEEVRAEVVECLHELADETDRWKNAWSATAVQADRDVRAAAARSLECPEHGREIRELMDHLARTERDLSRTEAARLTLVGFMAMIRTLIDRGQSLTDAEFRAYVAEALHKSEAAHRRRWTAP